MRHLRQFAPALLLGLLSASAFASTTVYTAPATFAGQLAAGAYTEDFNNISVTDDSPLTLTGGAFSYTLSADLGLYAADGILGTSQVDKALTITFTSGNVYAVGGNFFAADFDSTLLSVPVVVGLSDGTSVNFTPATFADSFYGFTSDVAITSLTIGAPGQSRYASLDNLTVGTISAVPEPGTWALAALGLVGIGAAVRRRAA